MPPHRPYPPQYSPPHPGRWRAASRAAPTRRYGLQPGDTRGHTVWTGTACGGADCKGDSTRIAKGILHASLNLSLRHEVARLIVWQVIRTRPVVPSNRLRVFKIANTARLGRGGGQERWVRMGPSENYVAH